MKSLTDCIPSVESLMRRANRDKPVPPTEESMAKMAGKLAEFGYDKINAEVYSAICSYGALLFDRTAHKGLLLKGECGIGKTFGVEIIAAIFQMPVFTPADFAGAYKDLDGNPVDLEKYVTTGGDFFCEPKSIVIDEIGTKDNVKNWGETAEIMADVLDIRYRAFNRYGVRTIVTTNLSDREIMARYGTRIVDRLAEMFYIKRVAGKSLRR